MMKKKKYIAPSIKSYYIPELCISNLTNATVNNSKTQDIDSTFPVHNEDETPDGSSTTNWYNNVNNWGGD